MEYRTHYSYWSKSCPFYVSYMLIEKVSLYKRLNRYNRLYITLVRSKLVYATIVWNSIMSTDANKLERIQQRFAAFCFNRLFPQVHYSYTITLEKINCTLCVWGGITSMHRSFFKFTVALDSVFLFCKLLVFEFLLGTLQILLCWMSASQVKIVPLLDALHLII
jgi:hypothetical protein